MTSLHICKQEHSPNPGIVPDVAMIRSDCSPWFHRACRILFQKLLKLALRHFGGEAVVICRPVPKSVLLMWETFHDSHPCYLLQPPGTSNLWSHQHHLYIIKKHSISNSCRHKLVECRTLKHTGQLVWGNRSPNTQTAIARRSENNRKMLTEHFSLSQSALMRLTCSSSVMRLCAGDSPEQLVFWLHSYMKARFQFLWSCGLILKISS